jgi:pre-rRNA-processing protein IPI3
MFIGTGGLAALLVTVSLDRTCKIYDIASGSMLVSLVFQEVITAVTLNRLETELFIGTSLGNIYHHRLQPPPRTREYHITDDDKINNKFSGHTKPVTCLAISLDEQTLISGSQDCNAITWNIQSRSILKTIPHKGAITNVKLIATPQAMFNREAKLELITKNFERMIKSSDDDENEAIEIYHSHDIEEELIFSGRNHQSTVTTSNNFERNEMDELRAEVEKLKRINKELFDFAAKNTIN